MRTVLLILNALFIIKIRKDRYHTARLWNPLTWILLLVIALYNGIAAFFKTINVVVTDSLEATLDEQNGTKVEQKINATEVQETV